jgi:putative phage-type endonuclease
MENNFLIERKLGIGGSDCAAVLGVSKWKTPLQVFLDKTTDEIEYITSPAMEMGKKLESFVINEYQENTGNKCRSTSKLIKSKTYPWLIGHIDAFVLQKPLLLEAKTTRFFDNEWGEAGTDQIPKEYLIQCAHYCLVCSEFKQLQGCDIAALGSTSDFRIYHYERNLKLEQKIIELTYNFWFEHVKKNEPPPVTSKDNISQVYSMANKESIIIADNDLLEVIDKLKSIKEQEKLLTDTKKELENKIKMAMGNNDTLLDIAGKLLATWKNSEVKHFNTDHLKYENPELYNKYLGKNTSRRFTLR